MKTNPQTGAAEAEAKRKPVFLKFADVPRAFMDETGFMLADYSVALGYFEDEKATTPTIKGSGVLVRKGNRFGVLTAYHCVHRPLGPDLQLGKIGGHKLALVIRRSNTVMVPSEVVVKHALAKPDDETLEPDLAFLEIFPSPALSSIKAIASFWSLDKKYRDKANKFRKVGTPFTVIGFPGVYQKKIEGKPSRHILKHMAYFYAITSDGVSKRGGWDYVEANNRYDEGHDLPATFAGVSGGPVWGLHIHREKDGGKLKLEDFCLIGIAFLQDPISKKKLRIRAHFIKSIYDVAWQRLN